MFLLLPFNLARGHRHNLGREHGSAIFVASNFIVCYCSDVVSAYPWPVHVFIPTGIWKWDAQCFRDVRMFVATDVVWPPYFLGTCEFQVSMKGCALLRSKLLLLIHSWCFSCVHVLMNCFCPLGLHEFKWATVAACQTKSEVPWQIVWGKSLE